MSTSHSPYLSLDTFFDKNGEYVDMERATESLNNLKQIFHSEIELHTTTSMEDKNHNTEMRVHITTPYAQRIFHIIFGKIMNPMTSLSPSFLSPTYINVTEITTNQNTLIYPTTYKKIDNQTRCRNPIPYPKNTRCHEAIEALCTHINNALGDINIAKSPWNEDIQTNKPTPLNPGQSTFAQSNPYLSSFYNATQ